MKKTTIKNIETGLVKNCDILYKSQKKLEVVLEDTTIKILLKKSYEGANLYIGKLSNMEFQSTGE